jgi:pyruvate,water dikinase
VYQSVAGARQYSEAVTPAAGSAIGSDPERTYQVQGTGCSAGIVRGIVTIVRDPRTTDIAPGSILVAEHTDPGWILVFPKAGGVIVERGSQLSHAAIVARELGIPAIVSLRGATTWLQNGDEVEMNGATGVVRVIAPGAQGVDTSGSNRTRADENAVLAHA